MSNLMNFILDKPNNHIDTKKILSNTQEFENHEKIIVKLNKIEQLLLDTPTNRKHEFNGLADSVEILHKNNIPVSFIEYFIDHSEKKHSISELNNVEFMRKQLNNFLIKCLHIYTPKHEKNKPRFMIMVGNSGAGKTSTLLKLAALLQSQLKNKKAKNDSIRIASIDNQKIAMKQYLDIMQDYLELDTELCNSTNELVEYAKHSTNNDVLLVDTISIDFNYKQTNKPIADLSNILNNAEIFIVLPANLTEKDIIYILELYKIYKYVGVILTKMDETVVPAKIIGICMEYQLPIAYISNGEKICDFYEASKKQLLEYFIDLE